MNTLTRAFRRMLTAGACALAFAALAPSALAQTTPLAVPTFHNIGLYWKPAGASATNACTVAYRVANSGAAFSTAEPLWYDPTDHGTGLPSPVQDFQYRGSIVNLVPNTNYEIKLTLASNPSNPTTVFASTRSESIPEGTVTTLSGSSSSSTLVIPASASGTASAYRVYKAASIGSHTINVNNAADYCIDVQASYVIIRGLKLANARIHGIRLGAVSNVIIEDCEIYGWGGTWGGGGLGYNLDSAIYSEATALSGVVVQRNRIRDPRYRANSWSELNESGDDHPEGPQAITFKGSSGGHIIRYNDFSMSSAEENSLTGKRYNDVMGETTNFSYRGFPGPDSDIYGNIISGAWDDGIEAEGGNANVRIFGNYITRTFIALGMATNSLGPVYVFRNVAHQSQRGNSAAHKIQGGSFIKLGTGETSSNNPTNRVPFQKGRMFFYHNTVLHNVPNLGATSQNDGGYYGIRGPDDTDFQYNMTGRNNILRSRTDKLSIEAYTNTAVASGNSFNYDIYNPGAPSGFPSYVNFREGTTLRTSEPNGQTGTPTYELPGGSSLAHQLTSASPGLNQGVALPNFNDGSTGLPDIGAHERGQPGYVWGLSANWSNYIPGAPPADTQPPTKPGTPVASNITSSGFTLNWTGSTDNVGVQGYDIFAGATLLDTNIGATNTTYVASGLQPGTSYAMKVVAFDAVDNENESDVANVQTLSGNSVPSITTATLPGGTVGVAYSQTLAATGGNGTLVWSISAGSLPAGLAISSSGVISGTPTTAGTSNFTVKVADSDGVTGATDEDTQALSIVISASGGSTTLTRTVAASSDDAEQSTTGGMNLTSSDLELLNDNGTSQLAGVRFTNITIPKNATIISAKLTFKSDASPGNSTSLTLTVKAEAVDNSATFTSTSGNLSGRTLTSQSASWSISSAWTAGGSNDSPSLTSIVQAMVNRTNWASGNAMTFVITAPSSSAYRRAVSFDGGAANAPVLTIQYQ